ncbi:MAG TPA: oligogalacturonate lyase family protein [Opitutus sp.]|nr:oligogalacturonate lyase family protein [Opitutus sp.]
MKSPLLLVLSVGAALAVRAAEAPPREWIDPDTGHRVIRLSDEPGTASLYFHQNAYSPDGTKVVVTTRHGIATIELATRKIEPVVEGEVRVIVVGRKSGDVYYSKREDGKNWIYATNLDTKATRRIAEVPRGGVASLNADETLMVGTFSEEPEHRGWQRGPAPTKADVGARAPAERGARPTFQAEYQATWPDGTPMTFADAKELRLHEQLARVRSEPPRSLFTLNLKTGEIKVIHREREWLNHVQFSPTDPGLIMFCHEGPWHEVDRIWIIRTDGTGLKKVHTRTMNMEIAGHEFFSADGRTIWYDLQRPRGEVFWLAGYEIATGRRTWYALNRNEWSVHFNVSPDGTMFAGDGGDSEMVAHAPDGKWIYLFRPKGVPDVAGIKAPNAENLIHPGRFVAEKLVNMSQHQYHLEPNVTFTPDGKWIVFRSNMHGATQVYAVEIAKAK